MSGTLMRPPGAATVVQVWICVGLLSVQGATTEVGAQIRARELFAVRQTTPVAAAAIDTARLRAALKAALNVEIVENAVGARLGIVLFRKPATGADNDFAAALDRWVSMRSSIARLSVLPHQSGAAVVTGRVVVQFDQHVSVDLARARLGERQLTIVQEPSWLRPTRFVVDASRGQVRIGWGELEDRFRGMQGIQFIEPDLLFVAATR